MASKDRYANELAVYEDGIRQLQILLRDRPPGWDLKALWLAVNLTFGNVDTFVQSVLPVLHQRARYMHRIARIHQIALKD